MSRTKMYTSAILSAFIVCLLTSQALATCAGTTKTFTAMTDATVLANPDRGFYHGFEIVASSYEPADVAMMQQWWTDEKVSLVLLEYALDIFVTSNISSTILSKISTDFQSVRSAGVKSIVRFTYTLVSGNMNDAALPQLLKHIDQLKPILQANVDVISVVQTGLVGTWGEWYYSKNYATAQSDGSMSVSAAQMTDRMTIVKELLKAVPADRMVQLRTPNFKQVLCGTANLSPSQAFNMSNMCSRVGIHNDCFMAASQDQGTFETDAQRTWLTNEGLYVVVGGESCEANSLTGCTGGVDQITKQRFSYLNVEYHDSVIQGWKTAGCFNKIANMMGYRLVLTTGIFPSSVTRGTSYCATINVKNTGVAPLYNARPVQVILRNKSTLALTTFAQPLVDPRRWAPGTSVSVDLSFVVPSTQPVGTYDVVLNMPDASASLASNPNYRVLFSNANGVQEASTRFNILGQVTVQ